MPEVQPNQEQQNVNTNVNNDIVEQEARLARLKHEIKQQQSELKTVSQALQNSNHLKNQIDNFNTLNMQQFQQNQPLVHPQAGVQPGQNPQQQLQQPQQQQLQQAQAGAQPGLNPQQQLQNQQQLQQAQAGGQENPLSQRVDVLGDKLEKLYDTIQNQYYTQQMNTLYKDIKNSIVLNKENYGLTNRMLNDNVLRSLANIIQQTEATTGKPYAIEQAVAQYENMLRNMRHSLGAGDDGLSTDKTFYDSEHNQRIKAPISGENQTPPADEAKDALNLAAHRASMGKTISQDSSMAGPVGSVQPKHVAGKSPEHDVFLESLQASGIAKN